MRAGTMPLDFNNVEQLLPAEPDYLNCQVGASTCAAASLELLADAQKHQDKLNQNHIGLG